MRHIVTRREWGARYRDGFGYAPIPAREVWLHHTAGPARNGSSIIRELERVGQIRFGGGMSYPFLVTPDGTPYEGLSINRQGAHTGGRNDISRAICVVGNYETRDLTEAQLQTIVDLLREGAKRGWWHEPQLTGGHRDLKATACPGNYAYNRIREINRKAASPKKKRPTPPPPIQHYGEDDEMHFDSIEEPTTLTFAVVPNNTRLRMVWGHPGGTIEWAKWWILRDEGWHSGRRQHSINLEDWGWSGNVPHNAPLVWPSGKDADALEIRVTAPGGLDVLRTPL